MCSRIVGLSKYRSHRYLSTWGWSVPFTHSGSGPCLYHNTGYRYLLWELTKVSSLGLKEVGMSTQRFTVKELQPWSFSEHPGLSMVAKVLPHPMVAATSLAFELS